MIGGTVSTLFGTLLPAIPLILVLLIGLGITITNWTRFPRIAMLVTIGLVLELVSLLLGIAFSTSLPFLIVRGNLRSTQFGLLSVGVGVIVRLLGAAAWILVLVAIFRDRRESSATSGMN